MNIADVVKWEMSTEELVYKFDSDSLRLGSQLIVYPSQTAFFVKGGTIADEFKSGTYTIKSENIPVLGKLLNIPFNSESPFKAEVWFVNQTSILDCKWGTPTNIQIEDPKYEVIVPVRAYGQYGFKINNPRLFFESFVGNMSSFSAENLQKYFKYGCITTTFFRKFDGIIQQIDPDLLQKLLVCFNCVFISRYVIQMERPCFVEQCC